jgi:hypothetical protein
LYELLALDALAILEEDSVRHIEEGGHDHVARGRADLLAEGLDPCALARSDAEGPGQAGIASKQGLEDRGRLGREGEEPIVQLYPLR